MLPELSAELGFRQCLTVLALLNVWHRLLGGTREGKARDTGFGITTTAESSAFWETKLMN